MQLAVTGLEEGRMCISQRKIALSGPEQEGLMVVPSSKLVRDHWSPSGPQLDIDVRPLQMDLVGID